MNKLSFAGSLVMTALCAAPAAYAAGASGLNGAIAIVGAAPACATGNAFTDLAQAYFKAGPSVGGGSNLPDGTYFVQVTDPSTANALSAVGTVSVAGGKVGGNNCVALTSIVGAITPTPNGGGVYKVSASTAADFPGKATKTDNFRIAPVAANPTGSISVYKFYDANANGWADTTELAYSGWKVKVDDLDPQLTTALYGGLDLASHLVSEFEPLGNSVRNPYAWIATNAYDANGPAWTFTGPNGTPGLLNAIAVDLAAGPADHSVVFGNVCIGPAVGGRTLGYWSNKNGQADMTRVPMATALGALTALNLVDYKGLPVGNFGGNYKNFRTWLLNGNAVNMAYMLSVQVAALQMSVTTGKLKTTDMVYAPGSDVSDLANPAGFVSIGTLISTAANQLSANPSTRAGISQRMQQEALKNAIDNINNNRASVAQPDGSRCPTAF